LMRDNNREMWMYPILMVIVSLFTVIAAWFIWERAGVPYVKNGKLVWCLVFPLSLPMFSVVTKLMIGSQVGLKRHLRSDALTSFMSIPFLAILLSWRIWKEWDLLLALFVFIWLVIRSYMAVQLLNVLPLKRQSRYVGILYGLITGCIVSFQIPAVPDGVSWIMTVSSVIVVTGLAVLLRIVAYDVLSSGKRSIHVWANTAGLLAIFTVPFLSSGGELSREHILSLLILGFWHTCRMSGTKWVWCGYPICSGLLLLAGVSGPEQWGIAGWVLVTLIVLALRIRPERAFLEISGAVVFVFIGIFSSILIHGSSGSVNVYVWPVDPIAVCLAGLFDVKSGVLFAAPVMLFGVIGYCWSFKRVDPIELLLRAGVLAALLPVTIVALKQTGEGPALRSYLPFTVMLWPFTVIFFRELKRPIIDAWFRLNLAVSLLLSALFFSQLAILDTYKPTLHSLLVKLRELSDVDFETFIPIFNHLTSGWSFSSGFWFTGVIILITILSVERRWIPKGDWHHLRDISLIGMLIGIVGSGIAGMAHFSSWKAVSLDAGIILDQQRPLHTVLVDETEPVQAVEMISWLNHSVQIGQEQGVAEIFLFDAEGEHCNFEIRAGVETAERVYDRPDVLMFVKHHQSPVFRVNRMAMEDGSFQNIYAYRTRWTLDKPRVIRRIEVHLSEGLEKSNVSLAVDSLRFKRHGADRNWGHPQSVFLSQTILLNQSARDYQVKLDGLPRVKKVRIVSNLSNAAAVPNGVSVGEIEVIGQSGIKVLHQLRSGVDTSEWAYDRPDLIGRIRHSRAQLAMSKRQLDNRGRAFLSHTYSAVKTLYPVLIPETLRISYSIPEKYSRDGSISILSITFL
jgi:hypothetical protein